MQGFEDGAVRVVALDASELGLGSLAGVPVSVPASVGSGLPIAIDRTVTLRAKEDDVLLGNLRSVVVDEHVAIGRVVAVETETVVAVIEMNVLVLDEGLVVMELLDAIYESARTGAPIKVNPL